MYLTIKYLRRIWLNWHRFMKIHFPALSPLAGKSGWLWGSMIFLPVLRGKGLGSQPAWRTQGSENRDWAAHNIPHKAARWNIYLFHLPERSFTAQIQVYSACLRQEKGGERRFHFCQTTAYLPQSQPLQQWIYKFSRDGLINHEQPAATWPRHFTGVPITPLQLGTAHEMLEGLPLDTQWWKTWAWDRRRGSQAVP